MMESKADINNGHMCNAILYNTHRILICPFPQLGEFFIPQSPPWPTEGLRKAPISDEQTEIKSIISKIMMKNNTINARNRGKINAEKDAKLDF